MPVGEMRDLETMKLANTVVETGRCGFDTLKTNSAAITVEIFDAIRSPA